MEVDAAFRHAGGARRVGDHRDLVAVGLGRREALRLTARETVERLVAAARLAGHDQALQHRRLLAGSLQLLAQAAPHDGRARAGIRRHVGQLARAQHRHAGHGDDAGLLAGEPRHHEVGDVGQAQEHAVAALEPPGAQPVGQAIHARGQLAVRDDAAAGVDGRSPRAPAAGVGVEQGFADVQPLRIAQLGQRIDAVGAQPRLGQGGGSLRDHASAATPSISSTQPSAASNRSRAPTSVMAGKCLPKYSR